MTSTLPASGANGLVTKPGLPCTGVPYGRLAFSSLAIEPAFAHRTSGWPGGAGVGLPDVSLFEASLGGVFLCLCLLRWGRGVSFGLAIALRSVLKKSLKGPAFAASVAVNIMETDNQTTIAWSRRFTKTASCHPPAMRVL
jgi:hypothetical protein